MKLQDSSSNQLRKRAKRARFNPLTYITPDILSRSLDAFEAGHLREAVLIWDALEDRDDLLRAVISKRKKSVARHGWTVLEKGGLNDIEKEGAKRHAAALEYFYRNLECEHAIDAAQQGGFRLLVQQMMDAVGKKFAVHEIVWQASDTTPGFVSAKFRFVPLAFFENTTGRLRFIEQESSLDGAALAPGAWMITAGDGLMIASSTAWMFKHLSLDDWLKCSQKNGTPGVRAISNAAPDSAEWNALERSVVELLEGKAIIHGASDDVQVLDLLPRGTMPFPQLVERVDRLLAALWRGADLSTISRDRGYGASLQEKETCALEEDDAEMLSETLHRYVDQWVIRHVFGEGVKPLARVKVLAAPRECTTDDIQIDEFLIRHGAPISIHEALSRYGRALPKPGEPIFPSSGKRSQANYPESSQHAVTGEEMPNQGASRGPAVSFRDSSPPLVVPPSGGSNERQQAETPTNDHTLPNQFIISDAEWLQLSPYGDFSHARGLQRVDRAAAETMIAQFNSFRGRLGRLFGGVPFYAGHPDLPNASELADRKAYGWIMQLEAREDGLFGQVKWSEAGIDLLRNAHYKYLSPYWEAREIEGENGKRVFRPSALVSVGLTNQPNIPVRPLANEQTQNPNPPPESNPAPNLTLTPDPTPLPTLHTTSLVANLGSRRGELARLHNRRDRIQEAVLTKKRLGLSYDEAWEAVKREHGSWFEA